MAVFEDLNAWKFAKELTIEVYKVCRDMKDRWFKDQLQRASISIMNNIAEWYERKSEADKRRFIVIAKWSCAEVRSMLHVAFELWYINEATYKQFLGYVQSIGKMLYGLIQKLS